MSSEQFIMKSYVLPFEVIFSIFFFFCVGVLCFGTLDDSLHTSM